MTGLPTEGSTSVVTPRTAPGARLPTAMAVPSGSQTLYAGSTGLSLPKMTGLPETDIVHPASKHTPPPLPAPFFVTTPPFIANEPAPYTYTPWLTLSATVPPFIVNAPPYTHTPQSPLLVIAPPFMMNTLPA